MRVKFVLVCIILGVNANSQVNLNFHCNLRNAKQDTVFDWWAGMAVSFEDSLYSLELSCDTERESGKRYHSYRGKANLRYAGAGYSKDTEKDIEFYNLSAFYPIKIFKVGLDYTKSNKSESGNIYVGVKWKWIKAEISFFDHVNRIEYSLEPAINLKKQFKIGLISKGLYIDKKFKWNTGINFIINI